MTDKSVVGPQSSVNERLVAIEIVRQILLLRFSLRIRKLVIDAINDTEKPIARLIRDAMRTDAGLRDPSQVRELDSLIAQLNAMRQPVWQQAKQTAQDELVALAEAEPEDQDAIFSFLLPGVDLIVPFMGIGAAALTAQFQGRNFQQWFDDAAADDAKRIRQALYLGAAAGESPANVARRIVGTAANLGRDGTTQISRNHIDTIVRSATVHFSGYSRDQFYRANAAARYTAPPPGTERPPVRPVGAPENPVETEAKRQVRQAIAAADGAAGFIPGAGGTAIFTLEQFIAILDSHTTKLCRGLDGNRYRLGVGPIPPLHMRCRSTRVVVLPVTVGGPIFDPGQYGTWVRRQPSIVQDLLMGSAKNRKLKDQELADMAFQDYGAKPMTLKQVRDEARRIMEFY